MFCTLLLKWALKYWIRGFISFTFKGQHSAFLYSITIIIQRLRSSSIHCQLGSRSWASWPVYLNVKMYIYGVKLMIICTAGSLTANTVGALPGNNPRKHKNNDHQLPPPTEMQLFYRYHLHIFNSGTTPALFKIYPQPPELKCL